VNLLTTLLLGVRERRRDVAILGAVGATRRQVTGMPQWWIVILALPVALMAVAVVSALAAREAAGVALPVALRAE
jgi:predicted lysophospholipase L1 biosynthesis ABC-type transport system permease subunit